MGGWLLGGHLVTLRRAFYDITSQQCVLSALHSHAVRAAILPGRGSCFLRSSTQYAVHRSRRAGGDATCATVETMVVGMQHYWCVQQPPQWLICVLSHCGRSQDVNFKLSTADLVLSVARSIHTPSDDSSDGVSATAHLLAVGLVCIAD